MRRTTSHKRGFTLLELLIAVTLVAVLSVGMLYAMRVGLDALTRTNGKLMANRRVLGAQRVLESQIGGLIPVIANCGGNKVLFFQGGPAGMRFVSSYSLQEGARGYARQLEYNVIPGENNRGVRLVVTEVPYTGPVSAQAACAGPFSLSTQQKSPFVLADKLDFCRLSYLVRGRDGVGWSRMSAGDRPPAAIRIEMAPLDPDPSRIQMTTMTVMVYANRDPFRKYEDVDPEPVQ